MTLDASEISPHARLELVVAPFLQRPRIPFRPVQRVAGETIHALLFLPVLEARAVDHGVEFPSGDPHLAVLPEVVCPLGHEVPLGEETLAGSVGESLDACLFRQAIVRRGQHSVTLTADLDAHLGRHVGGIEDRGVHALLAAVLIPRQR